MLENEPTNPINSTTAIDGSSVFVDKLINQFRHPENELILLPKTIFIGSKYTTNVWFDFENNITGCEIVTSAIRRCYACVRGRTGLSRWQSKCVLTLRVCTFAVGLVLAHWAAELETAGSSSGRITCCCLNSKPLRPYTPYFTVSHAAWRCLELAPAQNIELDACKTLRGECSAI